MSISATRLSYTYRRRTSSEWVHALSDVSLDVARGSLTGLIGPNGCGKTTLLKLLAGILAPDSGTVALDGHSLATMSQRQIARRIAVVPQETHPAFDYTSLEMTLMGRHPHLGPFELEGPSDVAIAREALRATGTDHLADRLYMTLSGGEKQRVVIASALAQSPEVLLLDEPTASLDLGYQLEIASLLRQLNRDRSVTMIMATHDLNLAASLCDTMVLMRGGRVIASGATTEVLTSGAVRLLYDVEADVRLHDLAGHLTVVPVGRRV
ncbi:MAG TPA: ABC transporter ATP-binding protein [Vicinamibacterales bacterium]|nr:ABC transporter ATP-binding protein [Vicinamibacterales bacterium]